MKINIITIFPDVVESVLSMGMLSVAAKKSLVTYNVVNLRNYTKDKHRTVDDAPYGGGGGMILMVEPIVQAVEDLAGDSASPVILLSPAGKRFDQRLAHRYAAERELTFICGRYKGVDERVRDIVVTEEVSIGDFILSGGEIAAAACVEAIVRLKDDVLGNEDTRDSDSFEKERDYLLDSAYYTRPEEFRGHRVPDVLLSGNHKEIEKWRRESSLKRTERLRPDLLKRDN
ncbi:MAG: tRNA (guanosine(37)-N1)-methyltransferase TrmD [Candidatus Latescibacterota bacterium]|nr:MAG: tRNA (guanosine(37)-N1)-methyltransferase TrmD [Candidatus Latescibacterota bacterium]